MNTSLPRGAKLRSLLFTMAFAGVLLSSCGITTLKGPQSAPTFTPTPLPTVSFAQAQQACGYNSSYQPVTFYKVNDLYVYVTLSSLGYPARKLPSNLPSAPFKVITNPGSTTNPQVPSTPLINPDSHTGFQVTICDAGSTAHRIEGLSVKIASFTPYTGTLNSWQFCDGFYSNGQVLQGGCGGGQIYSEFFSAAFSPTATTGAVVSAKFLQAGLDPNGNTYSPVPVMLQPGSAIDNNITMTYPTGVGSYVFAFSVTADGVTTPFVTDPEVVLLDPNAHKWTGQACATGVMSAQIPSDGNDYICPS